MENCESVGEFPDQMQSCGPSSLRNHDLMALSGDVEKTEKLIIYLKEDESEDFETLPEEHVPSPCFDPSILNNATNEENECSETKDTECLGSPCNENSNMDLPSASIDSNLCPTNPVQLFIDTTGPKFHTVKGCIVTKTLIPERLPKVFESLPIHGRPEGNLEEFENAKIKEFVGGNLNEEDFDELAKYCSVEHLKTGKELVMDTNVPITGLFNLPPVDNKKNSIDVELEKSNLNVVRKRRINPERGVTYYNKLKYRGVKLFPVTNEDDTGQSDEPLLEPGKDIIFKVRTYRPFEYVSCRERQMRSRACVFSCDVVLLGQHKLTALRDRIVCRNDADMRVDVSHAPDDSPATTAKDMFPSGFLFINNVFYVDRREGCADHSAGVRRWAAERGLGSFPQRDMAAVCLAQLALRLGHPEVYVHQGRCEHVFTFSEARLVGRRDALRVAQYPRHGAGTLNHSVYCTTCAEFAAKWVLAGCARLPFDPAFLCDTCMRLYLYKDGNKIGDFKAYSYRGNEVNPLKPQG